MDENIDTQANQIMKCIAENIKKAREKKDEQKEIIYSYRNRLATKIEIKPYTQKNLAKDTGLSLKKIIRIEENKMKLINLEDYLKICKALNINLIELFYNSAIFADYIYSSNDLDINKKINLLEKEEKDSIKKIINTLLSNKVDTNDKTKQLRQENDINVTDKDKIEYIKKIISL
ncbi:MAG: helix-turn-helix transcriptional regulator [Clostridia bacterium]|nr:helix-turn-helix transcriptional regulator [Clostridia bacterium]